MRDYLQIDKLDYGFILSERKGASSTIETAYSNKQVEEMLQKVAFFVTGQIGISVSFDNLKERNRPEMTTGS